MKYFSLINDHKAFSTELDQQQKRQGLRIHDTGELKYSIDLSLTVEVKQNAHQFNDIFIINLLLVSILCSGLGMNENLHFYQ